MAETDLIGDASKWRVLAVGIDHMLAFLIALPVAARTPGLSDLQRGLAFLFLYFAYFIVPEALFSATPGKRTFGLRVASIDGGPISWSQALVRNLLRALEANPALFGLLPGGLFVARSKRHQRLGDMLARTLFVRRT